MKNRWERWENNREAKERDGVTLYICCKATGVISNVCVFPDIAHGISSCIR